MPSMSISGVVSGMDWDSMIDEIITAAAKPAQVQVTKRTDLKNKKTLFEEMKVMVQSIQTSMTSLKLPSTYKAKDIDIERVDASGSYKKVLTATVNADAEVNVYDLLVKQIATAQTNRSNQINSSTLSSTLSSAGITSTSTMYITNGGQRVGVDVYTTDTLEALKSRINNTIKSLDNPLGLTASVVDNRLVLKSDSTGLGVVNTEETVRYDGTGKNTLSTIAYDGTGNFIVSSGGTTYTAGTDYVIVNGNEIRWKQYEDADEVALGDSMTVKYTMTDGDQYTASGTMGTSEAEISGFDTIDDGTLSQRMKIVDDDGNTYTYGQDFTITDGKVVWIDPPVVDDTPTTNEPDTYTVTYTKTETVSSSITGTKDDTTKTYTSEPGSYIVRYDDKAEGTYSVEARKGGTARDVITFDYDELNSLYASNNGGAQLPTQTYASSGRNIVYLDLYGDSNFKMEVNGTEYEYGKDYVIVKDPNQNGGANWEMIWGYNSGILNTYKSNKNITDQAATMPTNGTATFSMSYDYDYTRTARVNASDNDKLLTTVFGSDFDVDNFDSSKLTIRGYTYGTDFEVDSDGEITWLDKTSTTASRDDAISSANFTALQTAYNSAYSTSSIPTVTLTDADGVLRTYLDPEDSSLFTMTDGTNSYTYGKDYVIRVNDDRNGYVLSWAISSDANEDGSTDINDASTVVTTYTKYKDLSTYGMLASPADGDSYSFSFSKDITTTTKGTVNASDTDKSLSHVLSGASVDSSDYGTSNLVISDGTYTYTYGTDYTIDENGAIEWIEQSTGAPTDYTITYSPTTWSSSLTNNGYRYDNIASNSTGYTFDELKELIGATSFKPSGSSFEYMELYGNDTISATIAGEDAVYGQNYVIRKDSSTGVIVLDTRPTRIDEYRNNSSYSITADSSAKVWGDYANGDPFTFSYAFSAAKDSSTESDVLSAFTSDYGAGKVTADKITVKGSNGLVYTYNSSVTTESGLSSLGSAEFAIVDGAIKFRTEEATATPTRPDSGVGYTLTYDAVSALKATTTYDGTDTQEAVFTLDSGYGHYGDTQLSYEQILSDTGLTSSSGDDKFADFFTLTDDYGNTYIYGTDYRIIQGSDTDSDTSEHNVLIEWMIDDGGNFPFEGTCITLSYSGRSSTHESISTSVTRSTTDTINPDTSSVVRPLYSTFAAASEIRITDGTETYYLGQDFTVSDDGTGNAQINWSTASRGTPNYYTWFEDAESLTLTDDDGNTISDEDYLISADASGNAVFSMVDGSVLDADDYTLKVVKDGYTKLYDLTSDGSTMTITQRSLWESQDNTKAGSYSVYVTGGGSTTTFTGTRAAGSYDFSLNYGASYPTESQLKAGTTTITQGTKTFYEGIDYTITSDNDGNAAIEWITDDDGGTEWYYPNPGSMYTINFTASDGTTNTYTASRSSRETITMSDYGLTTANGSISVQYGDGLSLKLDAEIDNGDGTTSTGQDAILAAYSANVTKGTRYTGDGASTAFTFNWVTPSRTAKTNMPSYGSDVTVEYEYTQNTFSLDDDGSGIIDALGLNAEGNVTDAHNLIIELDGEEIERDSNDVGSDYGNEIVKGMTMHFKGTGEVSIDVFQDAEKAVEAINTFTENYNSLMSWMNTRMTESQVDEDTASTIDSDDFRMRWGLLHGNSLLRQTKSQMRNLMAQTYTYTFNQRASASEIYGTMANNGLRNNATLRMRVGSTYCDLTILPTHSLQDIVNMINDSTNVQMRNNFYDENGQLREQPLIKASIENDKLVLTSTGSDSITLSGTSALNALKMNYTYTGLFQLGIATTSNDYGKSGELEFDESKFMEALEDNPDEVQELMLMFANNMDTWVKSMLTTSASGETSGTLTRQIEDLDTRIASIDEYLEKYQERLDRQEEALRTKFAAAEQSIAQLSQQASSIAAILNQLNGYSANSSSSDS